MSATPLAQPNQIRLGFVTTRKSAYSETFVQAQIRGLPQEKVVFSGPRWTMQQDGTPAFPLRQYLFRAVRKLHQPSAEGLHARAFARRLKRERLDCVLAQFGPAAVQVMSACRSAGIPLIAHFHGYDVHRKDVQAEYEGAYRELMKVAAAAVVVSKPMADVVRSWCSNTVPVHVIHCGADRERFSGVSPQLNSQRLIAVGRFIEKKAPDLTIRAFAQTAESHPLAELFMVGDGPLLEECRALSVELGVATKVKFTGVMNPEQVASLMAGSSMFVQHSRVASDGDSEGAPVSIMEAQFAGLPVVSTRHAGIPEIVREGETAYLVEEGDHVAMANAMTALLDDPAILARFSVAAMLWADSTLSNDMAIARLAAVIDNVARAARDRP